MLLGWKRFYVVVLSITTLLFVVVTKPIADKFRQNSDRTDENDSYIILVVPTIQVFLYLISQVLLAQHVAELLVWLLLLLWNYTMQIILSSVFLIFSVLYGKPDPLVMGLAVADILLSVAGLVFWNVAEEYLQMGLQD